LICDTYIEDLIKTEEPKLLGEYIEKTDERNVNNKYNSVKGMSVLKFFRTPSKKVNMKNLSNYRVVRYNDFGYVQTTNNEKVLGFLYFYIGNWKFNIAHIVPIKSLSGTSPRMETSISINFFAQQYLLVCRVCGI
jgi:hypothetical protein